MADQSSVTLSVTEAAVSHSSSYATKSILLYTQFAYPVVLVLLFVATFAASSIISARSDSPLNSPKLKGPGGKSLPRNKSRSAAARRRREAEDFTHGRKLTFIFVSIGILLTFILNAIVVIWHALLDRKDHWWCGQAVVIYVVGSFFVNLLVLVSLIDTKPSPTWAHQTTWAFSAVLEVFLLCTSLSLYTSRHHEPVVGDPWGGKLRNHMTRWEAAEVMVDLTRLILLFAVIILYVLFKNAQRSEIRDRLNISENGSPTERSALRDSSDNEHHPHTNGSGYGTVAQDDSAESEPQRPAWSRPLHAPKKTWWEYLRGYTLFFPYLWPAKSRRLQVMVLICFTLVMLQRVINVLVPYQVGVITDVLSGEYEDYVGVPWWPIFVYIIFRLLQGSSGLLGCLRGLLWIPVMQYSYRELSTAAFEHVHGLSLDFHLGKKTGEVLSALSKGNSINTFLENVTFQVFPMLIDLCVAIGYFLVAFDAYYALVVTIITGCYLYITIRMAQWRTEARRQMVNASRQEDAVKMDSLVSYETVKYFNAEDYEFNRYRRAVGDYQRCEYMVQASLQAMNAAQNLCFTFGLLITCFIAAYQVTIGQRKVGNFVTLLTYMAQLQQPLNFFGTFYRTIQSGMINSERLLELFKEQPTVVDEPTARKFPKCQGDIRFDGVNFSYDKRKSAVRDLTLHCRPGTTTALVGESGGGKSTIFRLFFRFYSPSSGRILIDGTDVRDITIDSLRRYIGVVPQDTVLFNESVMYNLKYANPAATDEEVYAACEAASIHERILSFPDGYRTQVGERGLRLSGGEKQRVAIARTIIKDPRIILLDEATAALDTDTEQHIQHAFATLQHGRTMLVIAHRLSTITTADQILVLHAGQIVERGTHDELLKRRGRYASMWKKQIRAQKAAEEAQIKINEADRLNKEAREGVTDSASQSEDERGSESRERHTLQPPRNPILRFTRTPSNDSQRSG